MMLLLQQTANSCPRCRNGWVYTEGAESVCINCGHRRNGGSYRQKRLQEYGGLHRDYHLAYLVKPSKVAVL